VTLAVDLVFIAQVLVLAGILVWRRARIGVGLAIWLGVLAVLAGQGYFLEFQSMPPRLTLAGLLPLVAGLLMLPTHGTRHFLAVTPPERLIYLQSFRIVMEIILWALAVQGRAPKLMTFEGRNIDILVGLTAIPIGWMVVERRAWPVWVAAAWNVVGILILANVVIHAQLALPTPFRAFVTEPSTAFLATFPYIWLVGFLVPFAFWLHAGSLVQLARRPRFNTVSA
jgi:hypothetical protein